MATSGHDRYRDPGNFAEASDFRWFALPICFSNVNFAAGWFGEFASLRKLEEPLGEWRRDTYGGACAHGGGAFSGKDPTKVDRSAAYAARHVAKNIVGAGLARRCTVQLAYAIGVAEPVSVSVETYGTGVVPDIEISGVVTELWDLTPAGIIKELDLLRPIYTGTAALGHFGRWKSPKLYRWEGLDRVEQLIEKTVRR